MKFTLPTLAISCGMIASSIAVAAPSVPKAKMQKPQMIQVNLYAKPQVFAKVIETINPNRRLVPIFRNGEWVKVGDPRDGKVGWINKKQYRKAYNNFYRPDVQTIFVNSNNNKDGKPVVNIVAYSNGKKLTEKQAKALYERMQKQQQHQWRAMNHFNQRMGQLFARQDQMFGRDFPGSFMGSDMARPIIIVNQSAPNAPMPPKAWKMVPNPKK